MLKDASNANNANNANNGYVATGKMKRSKAVVRVVSLYAPEQRARRWRP